MSEACACDTLGSGKLFRDSVTLSCNSCSCVLLSFISLWLFMEAVFPVYVEVERRGDAIYMYFVVETRLALHASLHAMQMQMFCSYTHDVYIIIADFLALALTTIGSYAHSEIYTLQTPHA